MDHATAARALRGLTGGLRPCDRVKQPKFRQEIWNRRREMAKREADGEPL